jgi:two-component system nitrogen regulation response regulator NtrX
MTTGPSVRLQDLPPEEGAPRPVSGSHAVSDISGALPLAEARDAFEKKYLARVLAETKGNVSRAAERLGLDRTTLHRKMKSLGLDGEKD